MRDGTYFYVLHEVVDEDAFLFVFFVLSANADVETHDEGAHETALEGVPDEFRGVARQGLEEEDEAHPLVVRVVFVRFEVAVIVVDAGMGYFEPDLAAEGIRHGEGAGYPAEGVDDMGGETADDTLDGVPHELCRCDDETAGHQQRCGEQVVHPEQDAVRLDVLPFQVAPQSSEQLIHPGNG